MSFNWKIISDKIYAIVKGSAKNLVMYDARGNTTIDPEKATRFFANFSSHDPDLDDFTILVAVHDDGQSSYINIKTPELDDAADFERVYKVRNLIRKTVGQREGIKIVWQEIDHAIDPREEAVYNIKESKDVSPLTGTTKSSFQRIGEARLIIRHTDTVNEGKHGARTRHIRAIFVENAQGERFAFPHAYIAGARAFARHISKGGTNSDTIAESIKNISGDYVGLRRAAHFMRQRQVVSEWIVCLREKMDLINKSMRGVAGPKTYVNAESILAGSQSVILDETATANILQILAEKCSCGGEDPRWADLGVAAKYLTGVNMEPKPVSFSWHRRPNISAVPDDREVLERLNWQISELADACADEHTAARLSEIAEMIANNIKPSNEDIALVREAIASSLDFTETDAIQEEQELDEFLNEFAPEAIFAETDEVTEGFEIGKVYHINHGDGEISHFIPKELQKNGRHKGLQFDKGAAGRSARKPTTASYQFGHPWKETPSNEIPAHVAKHINEFANSDIVAEQSRFKVISCSQCGSEFLPRGRNEGFSHCIDHKGWKQIDEGWSVAKPIDTTRYQERSGLEGPFMTKSGKTVYYDPKEGKYYDPDSDFYIDHDDYQTMNTESIDKQYDDPDDAFARDSLGSRPMVTKLKDGSYLSVNSAGERQIFDNIQDANQHMNSDDHLSDDNIADSDLEENSTSYTPDIKYISDPYARGEVVAQTGNYYLLHDEIRYDEHTTKSDWWVWKKEGNKFQEVERMEISPYAHEMQAINQFLAAYKDKAQKLDETLLGRIKHLAGI